MRPRLSLAASLLLTLVAATTAACGSTPAPGGAEPMVEIAAAPAPSAAPAAPPLPGGSRKQETSPAPVPDAAGCAEPPGVLAGSALGPALRSGSSNLMSPYSGGGFGFHEVDGAAPPPRTADAAPLQLTLSGPPSRAEGQALALKLTFKNRGNAPLVVARPLDGSLEHWRAPMVDLYARDEASSRVYRFAFTGARCGNVNPIEKDDYATLKPGEARSDVTDNGWASYVEKASLPRAGRYAVWVVYTYCGSKEGGLPLGEDVIRKETHAGVHASNAVQVVVQ